MRRSKRWLSWVGCACLAAAGLPSSGTGGERQKMILDRGDHAIRRIADEMEAVDQVSRRLADAKTGRPTQDREEEILRILTDLVDALKEDREGMRLPPGSSPHGEPPRPSEYFFPPGGKPPLVADAAQLRMLRLMELRVRRSVLAVEDRRRALGDPEECAEETAEAAVSQRRVAALTLEMAESLDGDRGGVQ